MAGIVLLSTRMLETLVTTTLLFAAVAGAVLFTALDMFDVGRFGDEP